MREKDIKRGRYGVNEARGIADALEGEQSRSGNNKSANGLSYSGNGRKKRKDKNKFEKDRNPSKVPAAGLGYEIRLQFIM